MKKDFSAQPDLSDVLEELKRTLLRDFNCIKLGNIDSYDASTQTATIKLTVKSLLNDEGGVKTYKEQPILLEVPVIVLSGGTSYLSFPTTQGDDCLVFFNDRDIENWYLTGGVSEPNTVRMHDLSDAFALVGIKNSQNLFTDIDSGKLKLRFDADTLIEFEVGKATLKAISVIIQGNQTVNGNSIINGTLNTTGLATLASASVTAAGSGMFLSADGKTVTVAGGIVISII